jgi:hypothetical protein
MNINSTALAHEIAPRWRLRFFSFRPRAGFVTLSQTFVRRCQNCGAWAAVITRRARPARPRPAGQSPKAPVMQGRCVGQVRAASFRDSREACYFFPRGGGQADSVRGHRLSGQTTAASCGLPNPAAVHSFPPLLRPAGLLLSPRRPLRGMAYRHCSIPRSVPQGAPSARVAR